MNQMLSFAIKAELLGVALIFIAKISLAASQAQEAERHGGDPGAARFPQGALFSFLVLKCTAN
jgi:hypothetical protein